MADRSRHSPIFIDYTGKRWRRIRSVALAVGVVTTILALVLVGTLILSPPIPPELPLATANNRPIARATTGKPGAFTKVDRLRTAYRRKLAAAMKKYGNPASRRPENIPALNIGTGGRPPRNDAIVAGFYVNWADNSFASLTRNYDKLDWVIGEWGFFSSNADTLLLRIKPQVIELFNNKPIETRPSLFLMVTNFVVEPGKDSATGKFDPVVVRRFLANPVARANAIRQLRDAVTTYGLAGTTLGPRELRSGAAVAGAFVRARAARRDALHGQARDASHRGRRSGCVHPARGRDQRQAVPDALRRALRDGRARPHREPALLRRTGAALRPTRPSVEADPDDRRVRLRLERRRGDREASGGRVRLPGNDARGTRSHAAAARASIRCR